MLRLSRWTHCFERNNITAFLNSLSLNLIFVPRDIGLKIRGFFKEAVAETDAAVAFDEETVGALASQGILVQSEQDDLGQLYELREKLLRESSLELLYLLVTEGCDMKCSYCFEDAPFVILPFQEQHMSLETAKKGVDLFAKLNKRYGDPNKNKTIHFYGGEPMMNRRVIESVAPYIRELKQSGSLPKSCRMAIVTNGLLLDEAAARFFAENEITVGLSLDGPEDLNNLYRLPKKKGVNAFERTMRALSILQDCGARVGLSVTLTPPAIDHFEELLDFFLHRVGKVDGISLNLLHFNRNVVPPSDYYDRAARCQLAAFEHFREAGIYEERVMRKTKAFVEQRPMLGDCGALGNQLIVAPDGRIGVCQDFIKPRTYFHGNVSEDNADPIAEGLFDGWKRRSPFFMEQCFDCPAISICGGGCPASAELKTGSRWNIDERACPHSKLTLEWLIWETYAQISVA